MSRKLALLISSFTLTGAVAISTALAQGQTPPPPDAKTAKPEAKPAEHAPAHAAPAPGGIRPDSACKHDIETFCPNIESGMGRIYKCLAEKESELSNTCKARIAELRATGGECKEDIQKFCAAVPHTRGKLAQCLSEHHNELSEGCKTLAVAGKAATPVTSAPAAHPAAPAVAPPKPPAPDAGQR